MRMIDADALERKLMVMPDEELCEDCCYNVINEIDEMPTVGGWISVKDKTPEDGVEVLVWDDGGFAYIDTWIGHTWKLGGDFGVTHWMPLPEPPKEEDGCREILPHSHC